MQIVGRGFSPAEFAAYAADIRPLMTWLPRFVVVHNTSVPDLRTYAGWQSRPGWTGEQWMRNLAAYYEGLGWTGGPHLVVAPDRIWVLNPLTRPGTHSPSWNSITWGVETVGEFEREALEGSVRSNLVAALATLHRVADLDPADWKLGVRGMHFHHEDPRTTHRTCPGRNMVKSELLAEVLTTMGHVDHPHQSEESQTADTSALPAEARDMRWVQQQLVARGYRIVVDGIAGPATQAAVRAFQRAEGLTVDGVAGPLTRLALARPVPVAHSDSPSGQTN